MKMSKLFAGAVLLSLATLAQAHTHLKESAPAEGTTVKAAPESITLTFSEPAHLTALTVQKDGGDEQKITPLPTLSAAKISVPAPKLAPGKYTVTWRVVSEDNHIMSGKLHFTVAGGA